MLSFTVFKGSEEGWPISSITTKPNELTDDYVLVKIKASGVCGTDVHYRHANIVLGHEGAGIVIDVGPRAKSLKKNDRVGWGYIHGACGSCDQCLEGFETYCVERELYGVSNLDQGSFASHAVWREGFLHKLPASISDEDAAPLQCAGATVYSSLRNARAGETIGILGIGGLGHLAIQFAAKMGCLVVAFSGSAGKRQQALDLGAHQFLALESGDRLDPKVTIDRLLVTTSTQPNWANILPMMSMRSTIYTLSVSFADIKMPYMPLILQGISIQGSIAATRIAHREMLEFAAFHKIKPVIEKFPMTAQGIETAMTKMTEGSICYRAVLIPLS